jgi:hypothetical protein
MLGRIKNMLISLTVKGDPWEMGKVNATVARRNRLTGEVQFVLWKADEQGHEKDYWHKFGPGWDMHFKPDANKAITQ